MAFMVLGKLEIDRNDYNWIQQYRKNYDELYYDIVYPHFALVFPTSEKSPEEFVDEIIKKSEEMSPINFSIRSAVVNKDAGNDYWHVFLVPDEGNSQIIKLHDKLYSDFLLDTLRLDIQFTPHVGIANSTDQWVCKKLVDDINSRNICITGTVRTLDIASYEDNKVQSIKEIILD